eukprot:11434040-Karenia_brevis.AAC.1
MRRDADAREEDTWACGIALRARSISCNRSEFGRCFRTASALLMLESGINTLDGLVTKTNVYELVCRRFK